MVSTEQEPTIIFESWLASVLRQDDQLAALGDPPLNAGGVLRIVNGQAPDTMQGPIVEYFYFAADQDVYVNGPTRIFTPLTYVVRAVSVRGATSYAPLAPIMARVRDLLHDTGGQAAGGTVMYCKRAQVFQAEDNRPNGTYRLLGHYYHAYVR
jgi:hypothetical protein